MYPRTDWSSAQTIFAKRPIELRGWCKFENLFLWADEGKRLVTHKTKRGHIKDKTGQFNNKYD